MRQAGRLALRIAVLGVAIARCLMGWDNQNPARKKPRPDGQRVEAFIGLLNCGRLQV